jgi:hypothetical protein
MEIKNIEGIENKTKNRKIDSKSTKQIVIDRYWHTWLKKQAADEGVSIKTLIEGYLADKQVEVKDNI